MNSKQLIRIGRINFANVWPIFYHFPYHLFEGEVEMVSQVPKQLNIGMSRGEIDMGPISSFAYGEAFDKYELFPDLSVSSLGTVHSILLFHRKPLSEILHGAIALPNTSETSVNLLKILFERFSGGKPRYIHAPPVLGDMMKTADAALLIGDDAIKAHWSNDTYLVTDLGEEWKKITGQWMSFAVWAVRKETMERQPELVTRIYQAFLLSKRLSLQKLHPLAVDAQALIGGELAYWEHYFSQLNYDFGPEQWKGLQLYYDYAWELGLLDRKVPLHIWQDKTMIQVKE